MVEQVRCLFKSDQIGDTAAGVTAFVNGELSMSKTIHAAYENGVFRPDEPVDLPEHTAVEFEPRIKRPSPSTPMSEGMAKVYEILGERFNSGHTDPAARHDEHQP